MNTPAPPHSSSWKWWVCGLLLCATMINYMDRQTLANLSVRVTWALGMNNEQYGYVETAFGLGFALGSVLFGFLADRLNVRFLYPCVLVGWSLAGIFTGFATSYEELLICRATLGIFEAGHWPCALITTQRLLSAADRSLGNSVLQSGAAIGAIVTPPIVLGILRWADPGEPTRQAHQLLGGGLTAVIVGPVPEVWQLPFFVVGAVGMFWVVAWFLLIRRDSLKQVPVMDSADIRVSLRDAVWDRRFLVLLMMVTALNVSWQLLRAWLPKFLQQGRGYQEADALWFNSAFYIAADAGCLLSGATVLWLARKKMMVERARVLVYGCCAVIAGLTLLAGTLPKGPALLAVLLLVAAGMLGLFPCYYSFAQELTRSHLGRASGVLAASGWVISAPTQWYFGKVVDRTQSFDLGIQLAGVPPLIALGALLLLWPREKPVT